MDQHDNNITYKIRIQANITNVVTTLMVPIERIVIQSIWLKSGNNWINATHNDDVKYMVTFKNGRLYFYCKELHARFTGDCVFIVKILKSCGGSTITTSHTRQRHSTSTQSNRHSNATKLRSTSTWSNYATL